MLEFVQLLKQRYQVLQTYATANSSYYEKCIHQLILAEAFIRKGAMQRRSFELPPQKPILHITVLGPTQAGKSSIVNVLLNNNTMAGVSPLAGYTVHSQGFCQNVTLEDCQELTRYFGLFQQVSLSQLSKERYDCYSLTENKNNSPYFNQAVLWDTPDFDSIDSAIYREGVLRTIALADILILVLSKEKYADASVWEMMALLESLQQPTIICLNKLNEGSEELLIKSLKEKWQQTRRDKLPVIVPLYYQKNNALPIWHKNYQTLIYHTQTQINHLQQAAREQAFMQKHWQLWLSPILAEQNALNEWEQFIQTTIKQALDTYQRQYLNHPEHYESFQHALAQLLLLLEVPHLAELLTNTRQVLTWPVRQFMKLGRKKPNKTDKSVELVLLNQLAEHLFIQLSNHLLDKSEQNHLNGLWQELNHLLRSQRPLLLESFNHAAQQYHLSFQNDIEQTAQKLYAQLQQQPLILNSLRATRVTTDAAVIALTLYTGGIGVHDLLVAPAMLTVSSLLTESAVGGYMNKLQQDLKMRQLNTVKQNLFIDLLQNKLLSLPQALNNTRHFNISTQQTTQATTQLNDYLNIEKRHGLRLLGFN